METTARKPGAGRTARRCTTDQLALKKPRANTAFSTGITGVSSRTRSPVKSSTHGGRAKRIIRVLPTAPRLGTGTTAGSNGSNGTVNMSAATGTGTMLKMSITGFLATIGFDWSSVNYD